MIRQSICIGAGIILLAAAFGSAQQRLTPSALREHPAVAYSTTRPRDVVARLNERLASGQAVLEYEQRRGFLRSVLAALEVPVDSQVLVFSKTSFQATRIDPANPRALYFNDAVSVGWVRGSDVLEFVAQDPAQGAMFYTLEQSATAPPRFVRNAACVQCHTSEATLDVPGMFASSVYADRSGAAQYMLLHGVDHRTPFDMRWGGWYVTGRHGGRHLGNATATDDTDIGSFATAETSRVERLDGRFELADYPAPGSDIVALMVMEHQMQLMNLMTRVNWESRVGEAAAGRPLRRAVEELVDYLLFVDEARLPGPVSGTSTFTSTFQARGPRDGKGRSLRDFDLQDRLFRYPCSYLIYSAQFDALPATVREAVFARMHDLLAGRDADPRYAHLRGERLQAVFEILRDTKPGLPDASRAAGLTTY